MTSRESSPLWILAWDGAPAWLTRRVLAEGIMPNLARLRKEGASAAGLRSDAPDCSTPPAFAALWTGHRASQNGITSFRIPSQPPKAHDLLSWESGFDPFLLEREPLWIAAIREGRSCTLVHTPLSAPVEAWQPDRPFGVPDDAPLTILHGYGRQLASPRVLQNPPPRKPGPWVGLDFPWQDLQEFDLGEEGQPLPALALPDEHGSITSLWLAPDHERGAEGFRLEGGSEGAMSAPFPCGDGAWRRCRLFEISPDGRELLLWFSGAFELQCRPPELGPIYERELGPFGGGGDYRSLAHGLFGPCDTDGRAEGRYLETHLRAMEHFRRASLHAIEHHPAELMVFYHPGLDEVGHQWAGIVDEESPAHDPKKARLAWPIIREAFAEADRHLGEVMDRRPSNGHLILLSDHGMGSIHRHFLPNVVLRKAGFLVPRDEEGSRIDLERSSLLYLPANNGFVSLNREGRPGGWVGEEKADALLEEARDALMACLDPLTGDPALAAVIRVDRLDPSMDFHGRGRGELFLVTRRGYSMGDGLGEEPLVDPPLAGHHHHSPGFPQHLGIFDLVGPDVAAEGSMGVIDVLDVHEVLREMLELRPSQGPGRAVASFRRPKP